MSANVDLNDRPDYDRVLQDIADYVLHFRAEPGEALDHALALCPPAVGEFVVRHW